jgi:beta-barrel assembly-enhancing protease
MPDYSFSPYIRTLALAALAVFAVFASAQSTTPSAQPPAQTQSTTQSTTPATSAPQSTPAQTTPAQTTSQTTPAPSTSAPAQTTPAQTPPQSTPSTPPSTASTTASTSGQTNQQPVSTPDTAQSTPPSNTSASDDDKTMPGVKKGSIDDVNAVGDRNIGGRGMGNWYSVETEIKMGKQYAMEVEKSSHIITDPVVAEYINRIGQNIVKNSDCKVPFTIKVLDSDEINAFALPGGYFFVNSGLILAADDEAELAGVMAHETAHVCAHHAMREMTRLNYAQIASIAPLIFIGGWTGYGVYEAESIAIPMTFLEFSREFEAQADYLGIQYMYRAGYDPQALITFFEKIEDLQKHKPGAVARAFADHPQTPDRIQHSQEEIARILPPRAEYLETTSEFDQVKARLARIENKRRLNNNRNGEKPTLRRVNNNPNNPNANPNNNNGDEPPTLHRRDDDNGDNGANSTN